MLTPEEILRYKRQLVLKEIGGEGQQKNPFAVRDRTRQAPWHQAGPDAATAA